MELKKDLGFIDLFCIASGAMISSGLFVLPGIAYAKIGPAVFVAYLLASILVIPAMLCKAELATAMPKSGGTYFFIDRSMGTGLGTMSGLASWFSLSFKSAFALLGIGAFAILIFPDISDWQIKLIGAGCCIFFGIVNILGTRHAGRLQVVLVLSLLLLLVFYVARGLYFVQIRNFEPFMRVGMTTKDLWATAGLIFVSFGGLTKIASVSEEVKDPTRNLPRSMLVSFIVVSILYVLTVLVTVGILGENLVAGHGPSLTPISDGAAVFWGAIGRYLMAGAAVLAFVSTGNAGILTASRAPLAMSRDDLLPGFFEKVHPRFGTPYRAIIVTTLAMTAIILFLEMEMLIKTASTLMIVLFAMVNLAVIVMRASGLQNYRPKFKVPFFPWLPLAGIGAYGFLLFEMGMVPLLITGAFCLLCLIWFWLYGRIYANRVSALVHLVRRITARELESSVLNSELKEIIFDRDEIIEDRFDHLVKEALVLDLADGESLETAFEKFSRKLAPRVKMSEDEINDLLMIREKESTTALSPGLAIPHIILPGEHKFDLLLARSRQGIEFHPENKPVHACFILAGTYDERNFHLRALMSIAQIVRKEDFMEKWLKARNEQGIKDVILLSERKRDII